ncbi:hypothetical protein C8R43DRAFT_267473 [Mycena crocata]|nr:hypothetical protein C8R43DRAFT_267473 [Mycena crocata]
MERILAVYASDCNAYGPYETSRFLAMNNEATLNHISQQSRPMDSNFSAKRIRRSSWPPIHGHTLSQPSFTTDARVNAPSVRPISDPSRGASGGGEDGSSVLLQKTRQPARIYSSERPQEQNAELHIPKMTNSPPQPPFVSTGFRAPSATSFPDRSASEPMVQEIEPIVTDYILFRLIIYLTLFCALLSLLSIMDGADTHAPRPFKHSSGAQVSQEQQRIVIIV